jgi:hypothetical protein
MKRALLESVAIPCTLCAVLVAVSCGASTPAPADATSDSSNEAPSEGSADTPAEPSWKEMNREQRLEFMGLTVMPSMDKLFKEYDAEGFAEFKCQTCHGQDMEAVDYKLPNGLFSLPAANPVEAAKEYDAAVTSFMVDKITPKMAELLQLGPTEFGCFSCHDRE